MAEIKDLNQFKASEMIVEEVDVIVVGAGHAGCEAAVAAAKLGAKTLLFTMTLDSLANMPCNPNIGGTAKGQLVREIDALGGIMGLIADSEFIQFRMLNSSKGAAVLSPRAQMDRTHYQRRMKQYLETVPGLQLFQAEITELLWQASDFDPDNPFAAKKEIIGVRSRAGVSYLAPRVILATGTFLNSQVIIGDSVQDSGPDGLAPALGLSDSLRELGLPLKRFKTGTPARMHRRSLRLEELEQQPNDELSKPFSYANEDRSDWQPKAELPCWLAWTTEATKQLLLDNIHRSPLYSGVIESVGPRYCPSIEDKYVKFPDHERHHIFLEPTGLDTAEIYASGLSTSMPVDVQKAMLKTIKGIEDAELMRFGYAIEYDLVDPTALDLTLSLRSVKGLYTAGQINGSSGYEEAAAQGLIAGINAWRSLNGESALVIERSQAYIGVLIDDLVSKGTDEPYRMMTARAEYRLILRQDNADQRLTPLGYELGLISAERYAAFQRKQARIEAELKRLENYRVRSSDPKVKAFLESRKSATKEGGFSLKELLKRPEISYSDLAELDPERPPIELDADQKALAGAHVLAPAEAFAVELAIKYEGYIKLEEERLRRFAQMEHRLIPEDFDYLKLSGLSAEARQKLHERRPLSLGQAGRISGVSPADLSVLLVALKMHGKSKSSAESEA
ncbi:MAG: tRNA uridine-5-carboxymethylaminomethyl(34) synthesis enzyme MnmG [Eubacteriales bacterium]|nr:tRNA uridine-5-carboxymethylaminomethyl(34) synthesis enzyme MnmG [Eubacteriales bacterium]